ncbi:MAG: linear amide C-N hydrolase [Methanococcaceae archaeon]
MKNLKYCYLILVFILAISIPSCKNTPLENESIYENQKTLETLKKVDDFPLYLMIYYGDYHFTDLLKLGSVKKHIIIPMDNKIACTCFAALGLNSNPVMGRNFDWMNHPALLLFTHPPDGYASVSMVDISSLGYQKNSSLETIEQRKKLLDAPFIPFDGMNEKGVAVGMMAVPEAKPPFDQQRKSLHDLEAIRLILDYASSVDEAVSLLKKYNILFSKSSSVPPLHYLVADASGNSCVIEFIDNEMIVIPNDRPWQISTNFIISRSNALKDPENTSCVRYNTGYKFLKEKNGNLTHEEAMKMLSTVSQNITIWSVVYDLGKKEINVVIGKKYDQVKIFDLNNF